MSGASAFPAATVDHHTAASRLCNKVTQLRDHLIKRFGVKGRTAAAYPGVQPFIYSICSPWRTDSSLWTMRGYQPARRSRCDSFSGSRRELGARVLFHRLKHPAWLCACLQVVKSFDEMGLRDDLLRGIFSYGFEKPSAIQQRALLPIVQGRDVIAQAQSGTGKSSLIAMSICQTVDTKQRE